MSIKSVQTREIRSISRKRFGTNLVDWRKTLLLLPPRYSMYTGKGCKVAIISSGVESHTDLRVERHIVMLSNYIKRYYFRERVIDFTGYGTFAAGIIGGRCHSFGVQGIAPASELYSIAVIKHTGHGKGEDLTRALRWCYENEMDIVALLVDVEEPTGADISLIELMARQNRTLVFVNGKERRTVLDSDPNCISVRACTDLRRLMPWSHDGIYGMVDAGIHIYSTWKRNTYAKGPPEAIATPYCVGLGALYKTGNTHITPKAMRGILYDLAERHEREGYRGFFIREPK